MKFTRRLFTLALSLVLLCGVFAVPAFAAEETDGTVQGIGFVTATALRLRNEAGTGAKILATAQKNECVVILGKEDEWYRVNYNLTEGYMHESYLSVLAAENAELGYGKVTASAVNLRKGAGLGYPSLGTVSGGSKCYILGVNNGWYKVISGSKIGYIRSDYLELTEIPYENQASSNSPKFFRLGKSTGVVPSAAALNGTTGSAVSNSVGGSASGSTILATAQQYLGTPYVYGGASPSGFDCSGFVYYVLKSLGYSPARTPADQYAMGTAVSKDNLQPGDIVFFAATYGSGISHVGIYAGNGQFIHAPNSRSVVSYSDLTSGYWAQHYYGAKRV